MNDAVDVADALVERSLEIGSPLTNMKLQKMLYYAWIEYYNEQRKPLFENEIRAWKLGPVVVDAYNVYRIFGATPITFVWKRDGSRRLPPDVTGFLNDFADRYRDVSGSELVRRSHEPGKPWSVVVGDLGNGERIPFKLIKELECQRWSPWTGRLPAVTERWSDCCSRTSLRIRSSVMRLACILPH